MEAEMVKTLTEAKVFIKDFCTQISGNEMNESAKQVFFLDNQQKIKETMEKLSNIKKGYDSIGEVEADSEDGKTYELCVGLMNKLTETLTNYKNSYSGINPNVTVEQTTTVVNEQTINEAVQNNSSTKKIIKDMNEISEKANLAQVQEFTHAILVGKKFTYVTAKTTQQLNTVLNEIVDANPNEKVSVYEIEFKPMPLKKKTIYTV
jgi:uncharacterized protein YPO0396